MSGRRIPHSFTVSTMQSLSNATASNVAKADFHFHTTLSDGGATSAEAVAECVRNGVEFAVATEHDIINREFPTLATRAGIRTLEGVEISARAPIGEGRVKHLHLTSYARFFDPKLDNVLLSTRNGRVKKMKLQCEALAEEGFDVTHESFLARFEASGFDLSNLTNFHLAEYLVERPGTPALTKAIMGAEVTNPNDFIKLFLKRESPYPVGVPKDFPEYEPEAELVSDMVVRRSGGILSIAHPNFTFEREGAEAFENGIAENLVAAGINGIELNPHATPEWTAAVLRIKEHFGLVLTFGSDCHFLKIKTGDGRHSEVGETHAFLTADETGNRVSKIMEALA